VETKYARRESKAKAGSIGRVHQQEERDLEEDLLSLRDKFETEKMVHEDVVIYLRRRQKVRREEEEGGGHDDIGK